eukprot:2229290-Rhodomonas_salina.2
MMGKNNPALRSALFLLAVSSCVHFSEAQSSTTCTLAQVDLCDVSSFPGLKKLFKNLITAIVEQLHAVECYECPC